MEPELELEPAMRHDRETLHLHHLRRTRDDVPRLNDAPILQGQQAA
ncbi:hypothetical protein Pmani_030219, partial [Petrolisthes manimaculis]